MIRATGIEKRWGDTIALHAADIDVPPGVTGLLGPNGAGKTTFIGLVLGLHSADAGSLEVLGLDPAAAGPEVRARLGYVPEYDALPPDVSAQDLVRHIAELHGVPRRAAVTRASEALMWVGLGEERLRMCGTLSTGQQQRVKLAQAIAHDPALVLLDEPTNGLDPLQRDDMLALIRRLGGELGLHVLMSTHLLHEVERVCDAVVILRQGTPALSGDLSVLRGTSDSVLLEVAGDLTTLIAALVARGVEHEQVGLESLVVHAAGPADPLLDVLRDVLAETDTPLRRLERRTRSLEDIYLGAGG